MADKKITNGAYNGHVGPEAARDFLVHRQRQQQAGAVPYHTPSHTLPQEPTAVRPQSPEKETEYWRLERY